MVYDLTQALRGAKDACDEISDAKWPTAILTKNRLRDIISRLEESTAGLRRRLDEIEKLYVTRYGDFIVREPRISEPEGTRESPDIAAVSRSSSPGGSREQDVRRSRTNSRESRGFFPREVRVIPYTKPNPRALKVRSTLSGTNEYTRRVSLMHSEFSPEG